MPARRFKPTPWATLAAIAGIGAGIWLGQWQLGRAQEKLEHGARLDRLATEPPIHIGAGTIDAGQIELRAVDAHGQFEPRGMVLIDNRVRAGVVGYEVVMPLRLGASDMHVLVNRGWVAGTGDRRQLPHVQTPAGQVRVQGFAVVPGKRLYELSDQAVEGQVWQNLTIERYRRHMPFAIHPVLIQQTNDVGDGLLRDWSLPQRAINVHRSYALQWFSLAALIAILYVVFSFRRVPDHD